MKKNNKLEVELGTPMTISFWALSSVILPLSAIYQSDEQPHVWTVAGDQTVELRPVTIRRFDGNNVIVEGVKRGEVVAVAGVNKLRVGQKVRTEDARP